MSLEEKLEENTAALKTLNATIIANAKGGVGGGTGTGGGKAGDKKPKHSQDEVMAKAVEVMKTITKDKAKELIKEIGGADELKEVKPAKFDALYDACVSALEEHAANSGDDL